MARDRPRSFRRLSPRPGAAGRQSGQLGSLDGPLVGTALFFLAREFLSAYGSRHMILLGTLAVGVMLAYPQGLRGIVADRRDLRFFPVQRRVRLERN